MDEVGFFEIGDVVGDGFVTGALQGSSEVADELVDAEGLREVFDEVQQELL